VNTKAAGAPLPESDQNRVGRYLRRSREEVARLAEGRNPFDYDESTRIAPPATPEELAETAEFLRERERQREAGIAAEVGVPVNALPLG
jgi:hypothetical protein